MRMALRLAKRGSGRTSPNPAVGAVLVKSGAVIGRGWHRRAGDPHAEIEALRDADGHGFSAKGATLYVTLEPCSTHGRTLPCTDALISSGIRQVVAAATDPNPAHCGKGLRLLKRAGIRVSSDLLAKEAERLNEGFNHWIVAGTPFVTVKAAMTLDGKIATASGESKWITGEQSRAFAMKLRAGADAILVGVNTVIQDDPGLTARLGTGRAAQVIAKRRLVLDARARTPLHAQVVSDEFRGLTTIVVTSGAPKHRVRALSRKAKVLVAPGEGSRIYLKWLLNKLGSEGVTSLLVEGGGEVNASFLLGGFAYRVAFFYAPKVLGGRHAIKAVAGEGASRLEEAINLREVEYVWFGEDLFMTALVEKSA